MKLSTINYIRDLLEQKQKMTFATKRVASQKWHDAKETNDENKDEIAMEYHTAKKAYDAAFNALEDFNAHDWS